ARGLSKRNPMLHAAHTQDRGAETGARAVTAAEPVAGHSHHEPASQPDMATDPVCGMSIDPATARYRTEHAGKTYFFCGTRCLERFSAEPERFLGPEWASGSADAAGAGPWTCPMHPEIVRDKPGPCPICGMAL